MDVVSNVHVECRADDLIFDFPTDDGDHHGDLELGVVQRFASGLGAIESRVRRRMESRGADTACEGAATRQSACAIPHSLTAVDAPILRS
jgi:hypothetical protein